MSETPKLQSTNQRTETTLQPVPDTRTKLRRIIEGSSMIICGLLFFAASSHYLLKVDRWFTQDNQILDKGLDAAELESKNGKPVTLIYVDRNAFHRWVTYTNGIQVKEARLKSGSQSEAESQINAAHPGSKIITADTGNGSVTAWVFSAVGLLLLTLSGLSVFNGIQELRGKRIVCDYKQAQIP